MKIVKLIYVLLIALVTMLNAQTWEEIGFNLPDGDTATHKTEITFANKDIGWMFTYIRNKKNGKLYKTTDGGKSWQIMKVYNSNYADAYSIEQDFFYIIFADSKILFTTDGGNTWNSNTIQKYSGYAIGTLYFFDEKRGITFGDHSWITTDGGFTWNRKGEIYYPQDVYFYNEMVGWAVGYISPFGTDCGYVAKTTDGGSSWEYQDSTFGEAVAHFGVEFLDSLNGFGVGGSVSKTIDGGKYWQNVNGVWGYDVGFLDNKNGWISGWGQIQKTSDGGENWTSQFDSRMDYLLIKIIVLKKDKAAYVLGINNNNYTATLLKADLSNITDIEENKEAIPNKFYLYQNYPNPFNPSTVISYRLPVTGHVTLKIYDILGREVATLVNEQKSAGKYSVQWNGSQLASGVYISRLTAGKFNKSIKIILMK